MSEPAVELRPAGTMFGERLRLEVGILAGRLAELVGRLPAATQGLASGHAFLVSLFEAVSDGRAVSAWPLSPVDRRPAGARHPLDRLADALGLSALDIELVLLAGMPEEHEGLASVLSAVHPRGEPRPAVGLAAQLLCVEPQERDALRRALEQGPAVRWGLLRVEGDGPFFDRSLVLAQGIWSALHGIDAWPSAIDPIEGPAPVAGLEPWLRGESATRALEALRRPEPRVVLVAADRVEMAAERAAALMVWGDVAYIRARLPATPARDTEQLAALHALVRGALPILVVPAADGPSPPPRSFPSFPGPMVVCCRPGALAVDESRPVIHLRVEPLSPTAREAMWRAAIPELERHAPRLAASFTVDPPTAFQVGADAKSIAALERRAVRVEDVCLCVRGRTNTSLTAGATVVRPTAGWDQLVLPPDRLAQLREAVSRLRHQRAVLDDWGFLAGRPGAHGVRLLFAGPPGTGKTLSAEVLAAELGVDLLVVDISRVVSKWIGETEKHLAEVFDAAERAQAVLLFDEADALFGRRTEVSDAHDRYANLETAYLLSRLERFDGLAVLSTNLRRNIDPAFLRRLEFVVEFREPGSAEREALWRCHVPAAAPLAADVDLAAIAAMYPMVGALIRNAAVAAAFLAAADGSDISRGHVVRAIRREYEKAGRAFPGVPAGVTVP